LKRNTDFNISLFHHKHHIALSAAIEMNCVTAVRVLVDQGFPLESINDVGIFSII